MWLDKATFDEFEHVDYRFEYSDETIRCTVPGLSEDVVARWTGLGAFNRGSD